MALKAALVILFLWRLLSNYNEIDGRILSREEDLELEKELNRLTKPAVETILTTYGDTYDCVDFNKQPAFDHPSLQNHSFHFQDRMVQKRPTSHPTGRGQRNFSSVFRPESIWLNGKGCPIGTVPMRRVTKDDLIRAKSASEIYASNLNPETAISHGVHFAVLRTRFDPDRRYYGAGMITSLYHPQLLGESQYSSSQIRILSGSDSIIFGWTVNPRVYPDFKTRFFIYTNAGSSHCFNHFCGGFIHSNSYIPLDLVFIPLSTRGGEIHTQHFFIARGKFTGNWYLKMSFGSDYNALVGWWPPKIFTALADSATYIEWGGEVYSPPTIPTPEMGCGAIPKIEDTRNDSFCARLTVVNSHHQVVDALELETYADIDNYGVVDEGYVGAHFRHLMYFGGKGGYIGN